MTPAHQILTGLSLRVGGVVLRAEIDADAGTVRIVQEGQPLNGEAGAVEAAVELLRRRIGRVRPDLKMEWYHGSEPAATTAA